MAIPQDPFMLFSFVNMKLRDEYSSLESMCKALDIDEKNLIETLASAGFEYDKVNNKFV